MANRTEIFERLNALKNNGQDIIRREYMGMLSEHTKRPAILYFSAFPPRVPVPSSALSIELGDLQGFMTCLNGIKNDEYDNDSLDLILHSPGGSLEAAEQIVQYLRTKFKYIRAIIPQNAMSAATMIACACDEIVLGKESAIGPIDPQISLPGPNGNTVTMPAHAIIEDFKRATNDVIRNPSLAALWAPKLLSIPQGMLYFCEKTEDLSRERVGEWLDAYMFKNDETKRGREIAEWLAKFDEHKTHGRPINYDLALSKGLKVKRLEDDPDLQELVLSIYHATLLTFDVSPCVKIIENNLGKGSYLLLQPQMMAPAIPLQMTPQKAK